ncbi:MAG: uracil-DNA glycosylase [Bacilli bacterium]|nr:uracil-DNA glycosylase [Bacilli bacterium]
MIFNEKWDLVLKDELKKEYFKQLGIFVKNEYKSKIIYPEYNNIFNALRYTDYDKVKVVILGQDPYHGEKEAHGLSFSVLEGVRRPPSLDNIFKELYADTGIKRENNNLTDWAKQGVLLLNSVLTVEKDKAFSHKNKGWEIFTDTIIKRLNEREDFVIFVLWGNSARAKKELINLEKHYIIESAHPSPLSANRGFFGSRPFSKINKILNSNNKKEIEW